MPAYTFRSVGATSATDPVAPAGLTAGDLMLMYASVRATIETFNGVPNAGWTVLDTEVGLALMARIASGDSADDVVAYDAWSGTASNRCQICAFSGDVYTDLATIVDDSNTNTTTNINIISSGIAAPSEDNCLVVAVGKKSKTATSSGSTLTDPAQLGTRIAFVESGATAQFHIWNYNQQTTATSVAGGTWTQSITELGGSSAIIVALKSQAAAGSNIIQRIQHTENGFWWF